MMVYVCRIKINGLVRDLNPGPLAPKARIIPLDQRATMITWDIIVLFVYRFLVINAIFSVILVTADSAVPDVFIILSTTSTQSSIISYKYSPFFVFAPYIGLLWLPDSFCTYFILIMVFARFLNPLWLMKNIYSRIKLLVLPVMRLWMV